MEGIFLLVGLAALAIPILAISAWVRTGNLREVLEDRQLEYERTLADLKGEVTALRRSLQNVTDNLAARDIASSESKGEPTPPVPAAALLGKVAHNLLPDRAFFVSKPLQPIPAAAPLTQTDGPQPTPAARTIYEAIPEAPSTTTAPKFDPPPFNVPEPVLQMTELSPASTVTHPLPRPSAAPTTSQPVRPRAQTSGPSSANRDAASPPRPSVLEFLRAKLPLEELLGMNLFAKIGIVLLVLGFALLGRVALVSTGPRGKVALLYAAAAALLGGGIWLERKERYLLIGRTGIGGGWALAFFTTYAMNHVQAMLVMSSETLNCILLLCVAVALAVHTLRYQSQLVTGLAFLLAFSTVALTQDTVYALSAGVILVLGVMAVALKMGWYELEVFGILASVGNHFYWLYKLYPSGVAGLYVNAHFIREKWRTLFAGLDGQLAEVQS